MQTRNVHSNYYIHIPAILSALSLVTALILLSLASAYPTTSLSCCCRNGVAFRARPRVDDSWFRQFNGMVTLYCYHDSTHSATTSCLPSILHKIKKSWHGQFSELSGVGFNLLSTYSRILNNIIIPPTSKRKLAEASLLVYHSSCL
jgi:hypothetical protein